jgi:hypothetical protein
MQWSVTIQNTHKARAIATILPLYASDHAGAYPSRLNDLIPDYITGWYGLLYSAVDSGGKSNGEYDWLYFGAGFDEKHAPRIIMSSPQVTTDGNANKRIVVYNPNH